MNIQCRHVFAFSLVEVTLALGIATCCILSIFGLLLVGINCHQTSTEQTSAVSLASAIVADLRATLKNNPAASVSTQFRIPIPASGSATHTMFFKEDDTVVGTVDANADPALSPRCRVTLVFTVAPAQTMYFGTTSATALQGNSTLVRILITWPAMADKNSNTAPVHYAGSYETLTALDRS